MTERLTMKNTYLCPVLRCKWEFHPDYHYIKQCTQEAERQYIELYIRGHLAATHKIVTMNDISARKSAGTIKSDFIGYYFDNDESIHICMEEPDNEFSEA